MLDANAATKSAQNDFTPSIVYSRSLSQIIEAYEDVCEQLNTIADEVPDSVENVDDLIARERELFDKHAELLDDAMSMQIRTLSDAKAILKLWKNEVVGDQKVRSLSAGDQIVLSVSKFLEGC
jgi:hypothetical protein